MISRWRWLGLVLPALVGAAIAVLRVTRIEPISALGGTR